MTNDEGIALARSTDAGYPHDAEVTIDEIKRRQALRKRATPLCYVALLPRLIDVAKSCGYALCVHGSLVRDLDLVAVPWATEAKSDIELVAALIEVCGGLFVDGGKANPDGTFSPVDGSAPTEKPHGRKAWSIHTGAELYVDLSVMPRIQ